MEPPVRLRGPGVLVEFLALAEDHPVLAAVVLGRGQEA